MVQEGHSVASLTGGIEGSQRDSVIDEFRSGRAKVLITTNVLARGIDVSTVSMVINYVSSRPIGCCEVLKLTFSLLYRISPKFTNLVPARSRLITKLTCTVLVVLDVSAVLGFPSRLCLTETSGTCSCRSGTILPLTSNVLTPAIGTKWRKPLRRRSRTPDPTRRLGNKSRTDM